MKNDSISRQAAIEALAMADAKKGWKSLKFSEMQKCLLGLQSAQPEIIRCKDCKHYETHGHRCKVWNHGVIVMGYCYRAERSTDD